MNYIKQINGFWNWRMLHDISHGAVDLYFAILHCANTAKWKSGLNIPNSTLLKLAHFKDSSGLIKTRNQLMQHGLIAYQKNKNGKAGTYTVKRLYQSETECQIGAPSDTPSDTTLDTTLDTPSDTTLDTIYKQKKNKTKQNEKEKKINIKKERHGEFENVLLAEEQLEKLQERFGVEKTKEYIERLSGYMASTGKHYKNHYATILNWSKRETISRPQKPQASGNPFFDLLREEGKM